MNVYPFTGAERAGRRNVARACALLKVSRAAFYQHQAGPLHRERQDAEITGQIRAVPEGPTGRHGAPRVHAELRRRIDAPCHRKICLGPRPSHLLGPGYVLGSRQSPRPVACAAFRLTFPGRRP